MLSGKLINEIGIKDVAGFCLEGADLPEDSLEEYELKRGEEYDPELIRDIYSRVGYWHGTGRFRYSGDKYRDAERLRDGEIIDVLKSIMRDGLLPQYDPLNKFFKTGCKITSSLSHQRMYASMYAKNYNEASQELEFEFGNPYAWWLKYIFRTAVVDMFGKFCFSKFLWKLGRVALKQFKQKYFNDYGDEEVDIYKWITYVNKEFTPTDSEDPFENCFDFLRVMAGVRSDIEGNFPVLIGLSSKDLDLLPTSRKDLKAFESRIAHNIRKFTHIEVPLANIEETRSLIVEVAPDLINLPIIPFEDGELFCAQEMDMAEHLEPDVEERESIWDWFTF
ncbi:hypothetical protein ACFL21_04655 [Patescibacteria group bacterium]